MSRRRSDRGSTGRASGVARASATGGRSRRRGAMSSPSITGVWQPAIVAMSSPCDPVHVAAEFVVIEQGDPRGDRAEGEHRHALHPELGVEVGDAHLRIRERCGKRVDGPVDAGGRVEEAARRRRVVERRPHGVQGPVTDREGLLVHDPTAALQGELEAVGVTLDHGPVADEMRVRAPRHDLVEVPAVVDVVVGQEDPADVLGFDEREDVGEPLHPVRRRAGVDDHRLTAEDHHGVDVHRQRLAEGGLHLVHDVGVGGDLRRRDVGRRSDRSERHLNSSPHCSPRSGSLRNAG